MSDAKPAFTWSNSSLSLLQRCGEAFRRRYLEREFMPMGARALRGVVVHRVATRSYQRKLREHALPSLEEARDTAATEFEAAWRGGVTITREDLAGAGSVGALHDRAKDFAVDLSAYHAETVAPMITPVGVERKITVRPKDSAIAIVGIIDLIDRRPEGEVIRDLKTTEKSPTATAAETSMQLTLYAMIRLAEIGALPHALALDYLVRTPAQGIKKHVPLTTARTRDDVQAMVARINTAVAAVERGSFVPANPDSWWCSAQYCDYFQDCVYVRRGVSRPRD